MVKLWRLGFYVTARRIAGRVVPMGFIKVRTLTDGCDGAEAAEGAAS